MQFILMLFSNLSIHKKVCTKFSQSLNSFKLHNWGHTNRGIGICGFLTFFQFHFFNFIFQVFLLVIYNFWFFVCFTTLHYSINCNSVETLFILVNNYYLFIFSGFYRRWICNLCFLYVSKYCGHVRYNMVCSSLLPLVYRSSFHRKFLLWSSFGLGRRLRLG